MKSSIVILLCWLIGLCTAHADFTESVHAEASAIGKEWVNVRSVTWIYNAKDIANGESRIDIEIQIANNGKKPVDIGDHCFVIELRTSNGTTSYTPLNGGLESSHNALLLPKSTTTKHITFLLPDDGTHVKLRYTNQTPSVISVSDFITAVTTPCKRLARLSELFLHGTSSMQHIIDEQDQGALGDVQQEFSIYLQSVRHKACNDGHDADHATLERAATLLTSVTMSDLESIFHGDHEKRSNLITTLSESRYIAERLLTEDSAR